MSRASSTDIYPPKQSRIYSLGKGLAPEVWDDSSPNEYVSGHFRELYTVYVQQFEDSLHGIKLCEVP